MNALGELLLTLMMARDELVAVTIKPEECRLLLEAIGIGPCHLRGASKRTACGHLVGKKARMASHLAEVDCDGCKKTIAYKTAVWAVNQRAEL